MKPIEDQHRKDTQFQLAREQSSSGSVTANLLDGLNIDEYFARTASGTTSTFLADALGSTIGLVTANGGPIATSYTYEPFGATTQGGAGNTNPYQFTGRENDSTGLYYYRARYYSPTFQRFIAQDPLDFGGGDPNLYGYARNNPATWGDPLGWASPPPGVPYPPPNIPGGPWTWSPNPQNSRGGDFIGPKPPRGGPRRRCTYAPSGPNNPNPYWKTTDPNGEKQHFDENGNPITPDEAHPGPGSEGPSSGEKMIIVGGVVIVGGTIIVLTGGAGGLVFAF